MLCVLCILLFHPPGHPFGSWVRNKAPGCQSEAGSGPGCASQGHRCYWNIGQEVTVSLQLSVLLSSLPSAFLSCLSLPPFDCFFIHLRSYLCWDLGLSRVFVRHHLCGRFYVMPLCSETFKMFCLFFFTCTCLDICVCTCVPHVCVSSGESTGSSGTSYRMV